jgi:hypothetical protein
MIKVNVKQSIGYPSAIKYLWQNEIALITENYKKETFIYCDSYYIHNNGKEIKTSDSSKSIYDNIMSEQKNVHKYEEPHYVEYKKNCFLNVKKIDKIVLASPIEYTSYLIILRNKKCIFINNDSYNLILKRITILNDKNFLYIFKRSRINSELCLFPINY